MYEESNTLCWTCKNAVPDRKYGCSWSKDFKPVKGWKVEIRTSKTKTDKHFKTGSYKIVECPMYING